MIRAPQTDETVFSEINITPFTDVLLVLLIIFLILAALVVPPGFERRMNGCSACSTPPHTRIHSSEVMVSRAGAIFVDGIRTSDSGLYGMLARVASRDRHTKIHLIADARARYAIVIRVLDAAKVAGLSDVQFVTE